MAVDRIDWQDLPHLTRREVERHAGTVWSARTVSEGLNSAIAAILDTDTGPVFAKGLHRDYPRKWNQDMEAMINPSVQHISPRLLWRVEGEWDVLGFEALDGRHADYRPGSADLPKVAQTMAELGEVACPDLPIKQADHRWRSYVNEPADLEWLRGDRLLHTDYNPLNVMMVDGRALLVDWAWPTRGAGWIDPACLILRLIADGHTTDQAEAVVEDVPAWTKAPEEGLTVFAQASLKSWAEIADANPVPWTLAMAEAARKWSQHRAGGTEY